MKLTFENSNSSTKWPSHCMVDEWTFWTAERSFFGLRWSFPGITAGEVGILPGWDPKSTSDHHAHVFMNSFTLWGKYTVRGNWRTRQKLVKTPKIPNNSTQSVTGVVRRRCHQLRHRASSEPELNIYLIQCRYEGLVHYFTTQSLVTAEYLPIWI